MNRSASLLDDEKFRNGIATVLEEQRSRPFLSQLEKWLKESWDPSKEHNAQALADRALLGYMVRKEEVPLVQNLADQFGRQKEAFYLYWNSGLFEAGRRAIDNFAEIHEAIGSAKFYETDHTKFILCEEFATKWGIWGSKGRMSDCIEQVHRCGHLDPTVDKLLITGAEGAEKEKVVLAVHDLAGRSGFGKISCADLNVDPQEVIERCRCGGTVFLEDADRFPVLWHALLSEAIEKRRVLKSVETPSGRFTEHHSIDVLFIIDTSYSSDDDLARTEWPAGRRDRLPRPAGQHGLLDRRSHRPG